MRLLLIEDNEDLCEAMAVSFKKEGYLLDLCHSGAEAEYYITNMGSNIKKEENNCIYDLIILDRMLPEVDGLTILNNIRKKNITTPVIMVTAMNGLGDRIDGLDTGADDYVVKPFEMEELLARMRALLRRPRKMETSTLISYGDISFDYIRQTLKKDEVEITLSKREGALLELFLMNQNQILSREQILSKVWGLDAFVGDGNIDNYIYFLRRRLKGLHANVTIKTIHGIGYRMEDTKE